MDHNFSSRGRHLDANAGREVVYCHQCGHEWYKDEQQADGLMCPQCDGEAVEIVSPDFDPRPGDDDNSSSDNDHHHHHHLRHYPDTDSDPEEADLEEALREAPGPLGGFFSRRNVFRNSNPPPVPGNRPPPPRHESEDIIRRFTEMLGDMGGPGLVGRSGGDTLYASGGGPRRVTYQRFTSGPFSGGVSSFTITTGGFSGGGSSSAGSPFASMSGQPGVRMSPPGMGSEDPFQRVFGDILGNVGPPPMDRNSDQNNPGGPGRPPDIALALNQLFASVLNPQAVHGDGVYTQEALDRIITNLMETNPQSNAAAPASEETIRRLPRRRLDEAMLGPELRGECTICIEDVSAGDEVVVLPCNHWFHDECVVLWLRQHNTCPICRAPIEGEQAGQPGGAVPPPSDSGPSPGPQQATTSGAEQRRANIRNRGEARLGSIRDLASPSDRWRSRRDSNSPPRQDQSSAAQSPRVRSPADSNRRSDNARDQGSSSGGSFPFNWLRDRFGGDRR